MQHQFSPVSFWKSGLNKIYKYYWVCNNRHQGPFSRYQSSYKAEGQVTFIFIFHFKCRSSVAWLSTSWGIFQAQGTARAFPRSDQEGHSGLRCAPRQRRQLLWLQACHEKSLDTNQTLQCPTNKTQLSPLHKNSMEISWLTNEIIITRL